MSLPPVRKRTDYSDISKDDLVFALFYDRIAPTDALSEQGEERKSADTIEAMTALGIEAEIVLATRDPLTLDLAAWRRKAIRAVKDGKPAAVKFVSAAIAESEQTRIRAALGDAKTVGDVVKVFEGGDHEEANQRGVVGVIGSADASVRRDAVAALPADTARLDDEQGHVKVAALDKDIDALIDEELDAALAWAQKASEG